MNLPSLWVYSLDPVTVIAGSPSGLAGNTDGVGTNCLFSSPTDLTMDSASGDIYFSDFVNHQIRKISSSFVVDTFAGSPLGTTGSGTDDGVGTNAKFNGPRGIRRNSIGHFFVVDSGNCRVREITSSGMVQLLAGSTPGYQNGVGSSSMFSSPYSLTITLDEELLVTDFGNHKLRKISTAGGNRVIWERWSLLVLSCCRSCDNLFWFYDER